VHWGTSVVVEVVKHHLDWSLKSQSMQFVNTSHKIIKFIYLVTMDLIKSAPCQSEVMGCLEEARICGGHSSERRCRCRTTVIVEKQEDLSRMSQNHFEFVTG
jgi:hypothetical protein